MSESQKGLLTQEQRRDLMKLVSCTDAILDDRGLRAHLGCGGPITLLNPLVRFARFFKENNCDDVVSDEDFDRVQAKAEIMSDTVWRGQMDAKVDADRAVSHLIKSALELQIAVNAVINLDVLLADDAIICESLRDWKQAQDAFCVEQDMIEKSVEASFEPAPQVDEHVTVDVQLTDTIPADKFEKDVDLSVPEPEVPLFAIEEVAVSEPAPQAVSDGDLKVSDFSFGGIAIPGLSK